MNRPRKMLDYSIRAALIAGFSASAPGWSQPESSVELERVEVTGSRIKRTDIEGPSPLLVLDREDIEASGLTAIGDFLQNLTIAGSGLNLNFNNGGNGSILLDLRNLGPGRLLVLVNGRRWIKFPTSPAVDLTTIPTSLVERVEILKDGASAIYGSDAIAGVVNIITRGNFTGAQANAYYAQFEEGDGEQTQVDFSLGTTSDRASVFMNINAVESKPVMAGDREISAEPVFGTGNRFGSPGTPQGRLVFIDPTTGGFRDVTLDQPAEGGRLWPNGAPASAYRPWNPAIDPYNFAPDNFLLTPNERINLFVQGEYEITDNISFFSNALYTNRHSAQLLAANPLFTGDFINNDVVIHEDNPFNPFGIRFGTSGGGVPYFMGRRLLEAGNRLFTQDSDTFHFVGGLQGNFEAVSRFWEWETYYIYQRTEIQETGTGEQNLANVAQALGDPAECTDPCVPLNLFGSAPRLPASVVSRQNLGTITQEMVDFINTTTDEFSFSGRDMYAANLTGTLADLPAGPLGVAAGYEFRREKGRNEPDYLRQTGQLAGLTRETTAGSFDVEEAFVEFAVPILADLPAVDILEVSLATRYSDYSTFGQTTNSKVGLRWQPYNDLLLRGTYSEGFRAASIQELFRPVREIPFFGDPCSDMLGRLGSDQGGRDRRQPQGVIENCIADGVPADGSYVEVGSNPVIIGGNPNVGPETADSATLGVVFSPASFKNLDISIDYFDIELEGRISQIGTGTIVQGCYFGGLGTLCNLVERNRQTGAIEEIRNVVTNVGQTSTSGADFEVRWSFPETGIGFFELTWHGSYIDEFIDVFVGVDGLDAVSRVGFNLGDEAFPRWKSNLSLDWSRGNWDAVYEMRYIHHQDEPCPQRVIPFGVCSGPIQENDPDKLAINHLESVVYHNAQLSYHFNSWDTRLTAGIRNLFDKNPPVCFGCFANSYDPTVYEVPGRYWYLRVTSNF